MHLILIFDLKIVQYSLEIILHQQAGITQITGHSMPLLQAAIIEHLMAVIDDEGYDPEVQTLLEENVPRTNFAIHTDGPDSGGA